MSNQMRLEKFVASGLTTEIDNAQTRQVSGIQNVPFGKCTEQMLDIAKANLIKSYEVFGITEMFDESVLLMARRFGWSYPLYTRRNTIGERPLKENIPGSTIEIIERTNSLDLELYRFARARFTALIEQQDAGFRKELEKFKGYNKLMQRVVKFPGGKFAFTSWGFYAKLRRP
jgi:hypothetical protein